MLQKTTTNNRQVQRTKSWIFEALMLLMDEKPYNKIGISDITEKAGIARQTFYRNYDYKDDVIFEYLENTFSMELSSGKKDSETAMQDSFVMTCNYKYMIKNRDTLKKILLNADIENRIFREMLEFPLSIIEQYKKNLSHEEYLICRYKINYQLTGALRILFDWFVNDMPLAIDKIVSILNAMVVPKQIQYRNIPNIVVRLNDQ
jgi:AcrR family transcriptional regulator